MPDTPRVVLNSLGMVMGIFYLACAVWIGHLEPFLTKSYEWNGAKLGIRGTLIASVGLSVFAFFSFLRKTVNALTPGDQGVMWGGLLVAAVGQGMVVASNFQKDPPNRRLEFEEASRKYAYIVPSILFLISVVVFRLRGMH